MVDLLQMIIKIYNIEKNFFLKFTCGGGVAGAK